MLTIQEEFTNAVRENNILHVQQMLKNHLIDPTAAIPVAAFHNNLMILKLLLKDKRADPSQYDNLAITIAHKYDYEAIIYELTKDPRVRLSLFTECRDSLTVNEGKFLLFYYKDVADAARLYENFKLEENRRKRRATRRRLRAGRRATRATR